MMKAVTMLTGMLKMVRDCDDKDDIGFEDDDGVRGKFLLSNFVCISTSFDANLSLSGSIRCK